MSTVHRLVAAAPEQVWDVLADGWLFPLWVVGASRMRSVDATWPDVGSRLHHSFGAWPVLVDDVTTVLECRPGRLLHLEARGWPLGEAVVRISLTLSGATHTAVRIEEDVSAGPGRMLPSAVRSPLLTWRNTETLRRLAFLAQGRADATPGPPT